MKDSEAFGSEFVFHFPSGQWHSLARKACHSSTRGDVFALGVLPARCHMWCAVTPHIFVVRDIFLDVITLRCRHLGRCCGAKEFFLKRSGNTRSARTSRISISFRRQRRVSNRSIVGVQKAMGIFRECFFGASFDQQPDATEGHQNQVE